MRILYLTFAFQHPRLGGSTRSYYFLKELAKKHSITLLTVSRADIPADVRAEVAKYTEDLIVYQGDHSRGLVRLRRDRQLFKQMRRELDRLSASGMFDLVLFHGKQIFPVIDGFAALPVAVDFCDAASLRVWSEMKQAKITKRPVMFLRYLLTLLEQWKLVRQSDYHAFISCRDRDAIPGVANKQTLVIPNGIDLQYWQRRGKITPCPNRIIFTGVMSYRPNVDAASLLVREILPLLKQRIPDIELVLAGRDPSPELVELARREPQVILTGFVPDMRDQLEAASVFVAPLHAASGLQNKVQEALAMGVPVVTTPVVAAGLQTENGVQPPVYLASTAAEFVSHTVKLLIDAAERERLAREGRCFVEENFHWPVSVHKLELMCMMASGQTTAPAEPVAGIGLEERPAA